MVVVLNVVLVLIVNYFVVVVFFVGCSYYFAYLLSLFVLVLLLKDSFTS